MDWRVYLADGSTFDSSQGEPDDVPRLGIVCILQTDHYPISHRKNVGTRVLVEQDWWIFHAYEDYPHRWNGHDASGKDYQLMHYLPRIRAVRQGVMLPHEQYDEMLRIAQSDPDFPRKSAKRRIE